MYFDKLYDEVLMKPSKNPDFNKLLIVSGYATAAMSFHHFNDLKKKSINIHVQLIIGMTLSNGISYSNHSGFNDLINDNNISFNCSYINKGLPVHSKLYIWCNRDKPELAFTGSANYTQTAFCLNSQKEILAECNLKPSIEYFRLLERYSIPCNHSNANESVKIYRDRQRKKMRNINKSRETTGQELDYFELPSVTVSLLDKDGNLPERFGLNWGQRPEYNREPDQAYIRLTSDIYKSSFFPPLSIHFTVHTDDDKTMVCTRAQENGKAIHTPHNNSIIGQYFRKRLGVESGAKVTRDHLDQYGRADIIFYKVDDETYYMDFSK